MWWDSFSTCHVFCRILIDSGGPSVPSLCSCIDWKVSLNTDRTQDEEKGDITLKQARGEGVRLWWSGSSTDVRPQREKWQTAAAPTQLVKAHCTFRLCSEMLSLWCGRKNALNKSQNKRLVYQSGQDDTLRLWMVKTEQLQYSKHVKVQLNDVGLTTLIFWGQTVPRWLFFFLSHSL